ncbi:MAG: CcmD family protein [Dehalococcoidia bacterium]|nr:CcmD family protein [Dehalococcoidia bacterium]
MEYFLTATAIIWAVVFGYVLFIIGRQRKLRQEIESLKQLVAEKQKNTR